LAADSFALAVAATIPFAVSVPPASAVTRGIFTLGTVLWAGSVALLLAITLNLSGCLGGVLECVLVGVVIRGRGRRHQRQTHDEHYSCDQYQICLHLCFLSTMSFRFISL